MDSCFINDGNIHAHLLALSSQPLEAPRRAGLCSGSQVLEGTVPLNCAGWTLLLQMRCKLSLKEPDRQGALRMDRIQSTLPSCRNFLCRATLPGGFIGLKDTEGDAAMAPVPAAVCSG